jgi:malate synthase
VAHPGLVPVATEIFDRVLGDQPNQKQKLRSEVATDAIALVNTTIDGAAITGAGVRTNVSVALQYIDSWLNGVGAAAINNLMEDAATAEISRAQLWQWIRHGSTTEDGARISRDRFAAVLDEEVEKLGGRTRSRFGDSAKILDHLVRNDEFIPFLTLPAYEYLD